MLHMTLSNVRDVVLDLVTASPPLFDPLLTILPKEVVNMPTRLPQQRRYFRSRHVVHHFRKALSRRDILQSNQEYTFPSSYLSEMSSRE